MDLRKLRYFVGVAESRGFRRAAESMAVAQPSLSKHIRELEVELGTELFERNHSGIHLTRHGRKLLTESLAILDRIDNLRARVIGDDDVLRGSVRIGAPTAIACLVFGPLAERLQAVHPNLHLSGSNDGARIEEMLGNDELDLAVLTRLDKREVDAGCISEVLVREQCFLVGRVDQVDPERAITLKDVVRLPLVLTPWRNSRRKQLEQLAATLDVKLKVVAEAEIIGGISFARQGTGFCLLPYSSAKLMRSLGSLEIAPISDAWSLRVLARKANRSPTAAQIVVSEFIRHLFADLERQGAFAPKPRSECPVPVEASESRERVASF